MTFAAPRIVSLFGLTCVLAFHAVAQPPTAPAPAPSPSGPQRLENLRLRDSCILPDVATKTYYLVSAGRRGPNGRATVVQYTSKDLELWDGPRVIFEIPENWWS